MSKLALLTFFACLAINPLKATSFSKSYQIVIDVAVRDDGVFLVTIQNPQHFKSLHVALYKKLPHKMMRLFPIDQKHVNILNPFQKKHTCIIGGFNGS